MADSIEIHSAAWPVCTVHARNGSSQYEVQKQLLGVDYCIFDGCIMHNIMFMPVKELY